MRKYAGLSLALIMCISTAVAYEMAGKAGGASLDGGGNSDDAMFRNMDKSLADKLRDYLQIIDRMQKLSDEQDAAARPSNHTSTLSGDKAAPPPQAHRAIKAKAKPKAERPWWSDFALSMVVVSDKSRSAVINGKFVREGDQIHTDVTVKKIDSHSVILEHKDETGKASPNQDDNLKTLFVKPGKG